MSGATKNVKPSVVRGLAGGAAAPGADRPRTACRRGGGCRRTPAPRWPSGSPHGSTSNVFGSGIASTSLSWMRLNPSIDEPSNVIPSSSAFSSSAGLIAKLFRLPSTSVNHSRTAGRRALRPCAARSRVAGRARRHRLQSGRFVEGRRSCPASARPPAADRSSSASQPAHGVEDQAGDRVRIHVGVRATVLGVALAVLVDLPRDADRRRRGSTRRS